ncbi:unnamed protein product [Clonostachys rosea f. rosea IK726]|uniref:Rhodopsin domain-containing protein n=2 Tax=Bionectria ochroleuca TaxID=29856 RepID=A0A0B7K958_BIOOC|nr:unnamed protein product [Clonostachys rosea f. rosea IK726]
MSAYIDGVLVHMEAPEGYHVDFENPLRRRVPDIYYLSGVACLLSLLSMLQRFYTKAVLDKKIQADDYLLIFAYLSALATIGLTLLTFVETYAGVHAWEISEWNYCSLLIYTYISWAVYIICGSLAKLSLLAFYLRLSPQRWFYIATWTTIGFVIAYTIALLPTMLMGCKFVDGRLGGDDKITCPAVSMANAILNIVSDVILLVLPVPMVLKLQVRRLQKFGLLLIFGVGSLTIVTSIVRAAVLPAMMHSTDQSWEITNVSICIVIEANLFVMCAALPTLRKFFQHATPKYILDSLYGSSKSKSTNQGSSSQRPTLVTIGGGTDNKQRPRSYPTGMSIPSETGSSSEILPIQHFSTRTSTTTTDGGDMITPLPDDIPLQYQSYGVGVAK